MMTRTLVTLLLAGTLALAQGPRRGAGTSSVDMAKLETVSGAVTAINIAYGAQYPSISVNQTQIKVAPVWFFLDRNFELKAGDSVTVVAAHSRLASDPYLYAVEIANNTSKARIVLRDAAGTPLWAGPGRGRGNPDAPRNGAGCVDAASIATAAGIIDKVTMGAGIEMPTMVVKTSDGKLLTVKIGPERILLEADLELAAGQTITVRYGKDASTNEYLALQLTTSAGLTVVLRHDDGTPAWE